MSHPGAALQVLREAAVDGGLDALCTAHDVRLLTVFGSTVDPEADDPQGSVGMSNLLIHEYAAIDLSLVAQAAGRALADYQAFVEAVAGFLTRDASS